MRARHPYTSARVSITPPLSRRRRRGAFGGAFGVAFALLAGCGSAPRESLTATTRPTTETLYHSRRPTSQTFPATTAATTTSSTTTSTAPPATGAPAPQAPRTPAPSVSWPPYQPLPGVTGTAALTGLAIDDATAALPIIAVKIDNTTAARGQWGLDGADVIIEENVESITRFIALFQSRQPAEVGPVRSARTGDLYILAAMNRPILAWSGGNAGVTAWVQSAAAAGRLVNLSALRVACYRREASRKRPHNLVLDTACARAKGTGAGPARPLWQFVPTPSAPESTPGDPTTGGSPASTPTTTGAPMGPGTPTYEFDVRMDGVRVHWAYDAGSGRYLRFQDGKVHVTAGAVPITVTNVVVMTCQHIQSPAEPRSSVPVTVGSGRVVVYSGGMAHAGTWIRAADTDPWTFVADDGTPIYLAPGTTFVELSRS